MNAIEIVDYKPEHAEELSDIIVRNLMEVNIRDYSQAEILEMAERFETSKLKETLRNRTVIVASVEKKPIGTLSIVKAIDKDHADFAFLTIFVNPDYHRKGIGRKLIEEGERRVKEFGGRTIVIPSSITSSEFYWKMGYAYVSGSSAPDEQGHCWMVKELP